MLERVNENLFHMVSPFQPVEGGDLLQNNQNFVVRPKFSQYMGEKLIWGTRKRFVCVC